MAIAKALPLLFMTLSALFSSALAGDGGHLGTRQALADRGMGTCHMEGWIPACPGVCCSDGMSYAMGPETCPEGSTPMPAAGSGSENDSGSDQDSGFDSAGGAQSHDACAPATTAPPHHHSAPPGDVGADFIGFGFDWYTWAMTFHFPTQWYSLVDQTSWVLLSSEIMSCTTVSVSATDAAQASAIFSSYSASAVLAAPTETHAPTPASTGTWMPENGTVWTATRLPSPVVTAGAASLGGFGGIVVGPSIV
ncbi:hypothetical protein C8A01DRAFT_49900 [Parachaetomium inaequale]|uniref:Uncharacterized protein n=1 Tax=Parachaetomium inaequale TaxID=2588326 RepID=A0AAN6SNE6_9PEZI|nr:hypothetical protein C8A01DRAFT_49900 [Parachaetomium inaequale]